MSWNHVDNLCKEHEKSGGLFVRLTNDGDKVVGAFIGEPHAREVHWEGGYKECKGKKSCAYCKGGKQPTLRIAINFFVPAESKLKIFEGGVKWYKGLGKARDKYGLDEWLFEIERSGDSGDTKTTYTILPDNRISDAQRKEIAALKPHDLGQIGAGSDSGAKEDFSSYDKKQSDTIDANVASDLVARLKQLPRTELDAFLQKFGVKRIRDVKAEDQENAQTFVTSLEAAHGRKNGAQTETEIDPFA